MKRIYCIYYITKYISIVQLFGIIYLLIFCISGNPADLTGSPNGIFFGNNYELRGKKSERPVYVEVLNRSGEKITEQKLGVRINGGYNRQFSQKSMKFFARKSYSPNEGTAYLNCFNLLAEDGRFLVTDVYNKVLWAVQRETVERFAGVIPVPDLSGEPQGVYHDGTLDSAYFAEPWAIAPYLEGYAVTDAGANVVRYVTAERVYTIAGTGTAGASNVPSALVM